MKRPSFVLAFATALCALLPSACSSSRSTGPANELPVTQARTENAPATSSVLYVSSSRPEEHEIDVYDSEPPNRFIRRITDGVTGPNAQAVDSSGDLFVANTDGANVAVYPPHAESPSRVYTKDMAFALTPAVARDGTLYVSVFHSDGKGFVFMFAPHRLSPSRQIPIGALGLAIDSKSFVYASVQIGTRGRILKFSPNLSRGTDLGISLSFPGRLAIDPAGNIIACDQGAPAVDVFPPGATKPSKIIKGLIDPFAVAFDRSVQHLYVADGGDKNVYVYSYPGLKLVNVIARTTGALGLSVSPAAPL
jgi:DNA-binding beta-propeller fold protein YncE